MIVENKVVVVDIGYCSICQGIVLVSFNDKSIVAPLGVCSNCGAKEDRALRPLTIPMKREDD